MLRLSNGGWDALETSLAIFVGLLLIASIGFAYYQFLSTRKTNTNLREQIDNNRGRLRAIFQNAPAEIYLKDAKGRYLMINPQFEKLFNVKNSDVFGLLPTDIHDPKLGAKTRAHDLRVLNERKTIVRDELAITELGLRTLHTIKFPTFDSSGELTGLGAIVSDVTDLRNAEQELRQSQKMEAIGQLTGGVAHDFNNLLAVIQGNLELHDLVEGKSEKQECIRMALTASKSGAALTKNLLSFAKKSPLSPKIFNINQLVLETKKWSSRIVPKNIQFTLIQSTSSEDVFADESMAQSALLNIILNSKDSMPDGGLITIETFNLDSESVTDLPDLQDCDPGKYVCVRIGDTGIGIPRANIEDVFKPFYSTKPTGSGSGLGLSMVQGFMKQSGGSVSISSEQDKGTVVNLLFRVVDAPFAEGDDPSNVGNPLPKRVGRVLFAEDNDDVRHWIMRFLDHFGHEVTSAPTGDAAFSLFEKDPNKFDLMITDILMPGNLQGPNLANEIRKLSPNFPVIFLSGYPRNEVIDGGDYLSGDVYLMKPVAAGTLQEAVYHSLGL